MRAKKCMTRGCPNKAHSRGICSTCYSAAFKLVKTRATSWKRLETEGRLLPRKKPGRVGRFLKQMIEAK